MKEILEEKIENKKWKKDIENKFLEVVGEKMENYEIDGKRKKTKIEGIINEK